MGGRAWEELKVSFHAVRWSFNKYFEIQGEQTGFDFRVIRSTLALFKARSIIRS